jgi:LPXTG-motif cell wall-anchored protein
VNTSCVPTSSFGAFTATQAPEIDPTSVASGLALLVGGLLVLRGRKQQGIAV